MPFYAKVPQPGVSRFKHLGPSVKIQGVWKPVKQAWVKVAGAWKQFHLAGGVRNSQFNSSNVTYNLSGITHEMLFQPDGKMLLAGGLTSFNGVSIKNIVRFNSDETLDTAFNSNIGSGPNTDVRCVAIQSDGKIFLGGSFFSFNGNSSVKKLIKLNSDGTRDSSFPENVGFGTVLTQNGTVLAIAIQSDGKIVIAGDFQGSNAQSEKNIARLNADGTIDTGFFNNIGTGVTGAGAANSINALAIQSDGKILLGGRFTTFNGTTVNRLARLNTDGTLDTTFTSNIGAGFDQEILSIAVQSDNKIVLAGRFTTFKGTASEGIVRLNSDGTLDTGFASNIGVGLSYYANKVRIQSDGKIVVGGYFSYLNNDYDNAVNNLLRLNSNGTRDTAVTTGSKYGSYPGWITALAIAANGDISVTGDFTSFDGIPTIGFAKLTRDLRFTNTGTNGTVNAISLMPFNNWMPLIGGSFSMMNKNRVAVNNLALLNSDGTLNTSTGFNTNIGSGPNGPVNAVVTNTGGASLVAGSFTSFNNVSVGRVAGLRSGSPFGGLNTTFNNNLGAGANADVTSAVFDSNSRYFLAGNFTLFNNISRGRIVGLTDTGTPNTSFNTNIGTGANGNITCMALAEKLQFTPHLILCGSFTSFNGLTANGVVTLHSSGSINSRNTAAGPNGIIRAVAAAPMPSSRIPGPAFVIGGDFTSYGGVFKNRLIGLTINGDLDTTFNNNIGSGANQPVTSICFLENGQILLGGEFTTFNGFPSRRLVRLNANGTVDTSFTPNLGTGIGPNTETGFLFGVERTNVIVQERENEEVLVGGKFTSFNGADSSSIVRLGGDFAS